MVSNARLGSSPQGLWMHCQMSTLSVDIALCRVPLCPSCTNLPVPLEQEAAYLLQGALEPYSIPHHSSELSTQLLCHATSHTGGGDTPGLGAGNLWGTEAHGTSGLIFRSQLRP